jgi:hypothetical protein
MDYTLVRVLAKFLERALEISSNVADLFFGVSGIKTGRFLDVREMDSLFFHEFHEVISEMLACQVHLLNGMRKGESFVNRDC